MNTMKAIEEAKEIISYFDIDYCNVKELEEACLYATHVQCPPRKNYKVNLALVAILNLCKARAIQCERISRYECSVEGVILSIPEDRVIAERMRYVEKHIKRRRRRSAKPVILNGKNVGMGLVMAGLVTGYVHEKNGDYCYKAIENFFVF